MENIIGNGIKEEKSDNPLSEVSYMRKILLLSILLIVGSLLGGCSTLNKGEEVLMSDKNIKVQDLEMYVEEEIQFGKYEPIEGIYLGAYVERGNHLGGDIRTFEDLVGTKQAFKVFDYNPNTRLSDTELLKCIANKKTPYIKLFLNNEEDLVPLYRLVMDLKSTYSIPVFIELYPLTHSIGSNPVTYKATFRRGVEVVQKYLKDAVVVWSVDDSRIYDAPLYYPGDDYIDWAGLNIYIPRYKYNEKYVYKGNEDFDFWYKSFQKKKPMMISALAVSHFSRIDHTYTTYEAADKLSYFYKEITDTYPRLKAILYMDVDLSQVTSDGKEDYRITSQKELVQVAYDIFGKLDAVSTLEQSMSKKNYCYMKYTVEGAFFDEELFIPKIYMRSCFKGIPLNELSIKEDLSGEKYYAFKEIKEYNDCYYDALKSIK